MLDTLKKKYSIKISEYQRQYLSRLVMKDIELAKKKDFPVSEEVEKLDLILLKD